MAQVTLNNGSTFLVQRTAINDNFTEVYATNATQTSNIATNTSNIATNTTNIATNTTNIATNTSAIATLNTYVQDIKVLAWTSRDTPAGGAGTAIRFFTGTGAPGDILPCVWTGTAWKVLAPTPIILYSTLTSGVAQTAEQVIPATAQSYNIIKAGLLGACSTFRVEMSPAKTGTTDGMTIAKTRLGTANTTSDTSLAGLGSGGIATSDRMRSGMIHRYKVNSATQLGIVHSAASAGGMLGASSSTSAGTTYTITDHTANDLYLTVSVSMAGTTDTPQFATLALVLEP